MTSQADPLHSTALAETPLLVLKLKHIFEQDSQSPEKPLSDGDPTLSPGIRSNA